jgi:uncharacterized membrane protein (DUF4010 family)
LHAWVQRLTWAELRSALTLLAMTFVALPLLPREAIDPWGAIKPFEIWLMTIMIAAMSFAGYVAIRVAGPTAGIIMTAIAGGLASSTAVTVTLARLAPRDGSRPGPLVAGALLAGAVMMVRVLAVLAAFRLDLMLRLALPIGLAAAASAAVGASLARSTGAQTAAHAAIDVKNPLDLAMVLKFGVLLMVVTALARLAVLAAGPAGIYLVAALSGFADVDAITLSIAHQAGTSLTLETGARAIAVAVGVNTAAKAALGWAAGGRGFGLPLLAMAGVVAAILAIAFILAG